jgi:hypothetical protein
LLGRRLQRNLPREANATARRLYCADFKCYLIDTDMYFAPEATF